jgi:hypothetical protein
MRTKSFRKFAAGAALAMLAVLPACAFPGGGLPGGGTPATSQSVCESHGGTFATPQGVLWTCGSTRDFPYSELSDACRNDGGTGFEFDALVDRFVCRA